ncbi:hypothetical protein [Prosthecochloris sp.]|uniref:hypothetical protein n=1 Tax=Prosthecochloris sp. TaxID=290513 RepID=UPI0025EFFE6F|nr:hypothetical protein [Prosthecochloris sp.]
MSSSRLPTLSSIGQPIFGIDFSRPTPSIMACGPHAAASEPSQKSTEAMTHRKSSCMTSSAHGTRFMNLDRFDLE